MINIDAHHHLWHFDPERFPWIDGTMGVLKKDYLPQDLDRFHLNSARTWIHGIGKCVPTDGNCGGLKNGHHIVILEN